MIPESVLTLGTKLKDRSLEGNYPGSLIRDLSLGLKESIDSIRKTGKSDFSRIEMTVKWLVDFVGPNREYGLHLNDLVADGDPLVSHSVNVACISLDIAASCGISKSALYPFCQGAVLHDIGYAAIGLDNPRVAGENFDEGINPAPESTHPGKGVELLTRCGIEDDTTLNVVYNHHERFDGHGYPRGLKGNSIGLLEGIVAVANDFENFMRGYTGGNFQPNENRMCRILRDSGRAYLPSAVRAFVYSMGIYPIGSFVRLNTGRIGLVVENSPGSISMPIVLLANEPEDDPNEPDRFSDLSADPGTDVRQVFCPSEDFEFFKAHFQ